MNDPTSYNGDSLRSTARQEGDVIAPEEVRAELRTILGTDAFRRSAHSSRLLQTLVEYTLAGRADELKEYSLALEALDRKPSFDPHLDPIVRVEAGRLRKKLNKYYENEGREHSIRILLPLRRYAAGFSRQAATPPAAHAVVPAVKSRVRARLSGTRWILPFLPVLLVIVSGIVWQKRQPAAVRPSPGSATSIAVLPFSDLTPGSTQELLSDALTEEIIEALGHIQNVRVVSRQGTLYLKRTNDGVIEIGRRLGVSYILEGSVDRSGGRVRVIARLVNAADGYRLWSTSFVDGLRETSLVHQRMAHKIVDELRQQLGMRFNRPLAERSLSNPEAYQLFLKGVSFSRRWSAADLRKSVGFFERALAAAPDYAPAWSGLADAYILLAACGGMAPSQAMEKARTAATRALSLDAGIAHAHASLAFVSGVYDWDWKTAETEFRLAHDLDPGDARIHEAWVTGYLVPLGRLDEALKQIHEAEELDPVSVRIVSAVGNTCFFRREYSCAIEQAQKALELDASFFPAYLTLSDTYAAKGLAPEAAAALEKWSTAAGTPPHMPSTNALLLPWLEEAVRSRLAIATQLNVHPGFDVLRADPRFRALVKRVGLSAE